MTQTSIFKEWIKETYDKAGISMQMVSGGNGYAIDVYYEDYLIAYVVSDTISVRKWFGIPPMISIDLSDPSCFTTMKSHIDLCIKGINAIIN